MKLLLLKTFLIFLLTLSFFHSVYAIDKAYSNITADVKISVCGNDLVEGGEQCEPNVNTNLTCEDFNLIGPKLSCDNSCSLIFDECRTPIKSIPKVTEIIAFILKDFDNNKDNMLDISELKYATTLWVSSWRVFQKGSSSDQICDINKDTNCNIVDLSILFYYVRNE